MVPTGLRIVLDGQNEGLLPELAVTDRFNDATEGQVVVGNARGRRGLACGGATGVVVGQANEDHLREFTLGFKGLELADEVIGPVLVGHRHVPTDVVRRRVRNQGRHHRPTGENHLVGLALPSPIAGQIGDETFLLGIAPADGGGGELAVIAQGLAVLEGIVPDEARRRIRQGIVLVFAHAVRVAARESGEGLLHVIGGKGRGGPLMPVGAQNSGAVRIVQQGKVAGDLVQVGGDLLAEDAQVSAAITPGIVAEDLVVGPVLLDHINHVLEDTGLANALGNRPRFHPGPRRQSGGHNRLATQVAGHRLRELAQMTPARQRDHGQGSVVLV